MLEIRLKPEVDESRLMPNVGNNHVVGMPKSGEDGKYYVYSEGELATETPLTIKEFAQFVDGFSYRIVGFQWVTVSNYASDRHMGYYTVDYIYYLSSGGDKYPPSFEETLDLWVSRRDRQAAS